MTDWETLADHALAGDAPTREDALAVLTAPDEALLPLLGAAFRVRERFHGRDVRLHVLQNAKLGACPEDCGFCSQSAHFDSGIGRKKLQTADEIVAGARRAAEMGAVKYCIVTATRGPSERDLDVICDAVRTIKATYEINICTSLGLLKDGQAERLAAAGVTRFNHNLESSERFFPEVVGSHGWEDRVATVQRAKAAGLEACCGGIMGMGETLEDRIDLAFSLRDLEVESIPVNFLDPRPGTPMGDRERMTPQECLKTLAMMRFVNPSRDIRIAGGREVNLRSMQVLALYPANSLFVDGYLTTPGAGYEHDLQMIRDAGFTVAELHPGMTAPDAATLRALDQRAVWHPFTPHSVYADEHPLMVVAGEGHWLIDADGSRYLDGVASLWCNLFGHRRAELDRAITEQLGRFAHSTFLGNSSAPAVTLAARLVDLAPAGLTRAFFSDNGSTAVEVAMKMAYQYWQQNGPESNRKRTRFVTLGEAYHGDTVGAVSLGGIELFHERYRPLLFTTIKIPSPHSYRIPDGMTREEWAEQCLRESEAIIAQHAGEIAAVVVEPGVQGAAGMIVQPHGYARRLQDAARAAGAFFVADEVAVGFGRSGKLFASEIEELTPDFLCLAKGLTGGYLPMAVTLTTERIFEGFSGPPHEGRTFFHGHTYTGNALAAAAAHATLDLLPSVLDALPATIEHFTRRCDALRQLPAVGDVRRFGLALGVELVKDRASREAFPSSERTGMKVCTAAKRRGVFLRPLGDVVVVMPPLTILPDEIDLLFDVLELSIRECCA